ncbi:hypothetical protein L6164_012046 [Bauhinia variegata]|uniref:Uncharacterized protein n=1 Tax=Bauhinia variegata TaxID=167791 RepID=A0ACB9PAD5_BAUVA|nr:hypothetical protein L6164_012046 [Bauhinia variegata]
MILERSMHELRENMHTISELMACKSQVDESPNQSSVFVWLKKRRATSKSKSMTFLNRRLGRFGSQEPGSLWIPLRDISDGLPLALCTTIPVDELSSFRDLIARLGDSPDAPPVTCILSDGVMGFTLKVAHEFNIPEFMLFKPSACGLFGYLNFEELQKRCYFPLKGYLFINIQF